ncbi:MAG: hypothetical protein ACLFTT_17510 [Candidatus Hydrogenedentota bacterium]
MGERILRHGLLYLLAFAWPWGVYQQEHMFYTPFAVLPGLVLALLAVRRLMHGRRPTTPFEFTWPLAIVLGAAVAHALTRATPHSALEALAAVMVYLAVIESIHSRALTVRCLWLTVLGGAGASCVHLVAYFRPFYGYVLYRLMPTAYDPATGAVAAFAPSVADATLTLLVCGTLGTALVFARGMRWWRRGLTVTALLPITAALGTLAWEVFIRPGALPVGPADAAAAIREAYAAWRPTVYAVSVPALAGGAAVLWLMSRIAAKGLLTAREQGDALHLGAVAALAFTGVFMVLIPVPPRLGFALVLGLAARDTMVYRALPDMPVRGLAWIVVLLGPLIAANIVHVAPDNPHDPRNYPETVRLLDEAGHDEAVERYLAFVEHYSPTERRTAFLRARRALDAIRLPQAADCFVRAVSPPPAGPAPLFPPPTQAEQRRFLAVLRDAVSARPRDQRGLAYERALAAAGQPGNALESLRFRARPRPHYTGGGSNTFARLLAGLLSAPACAIELRTWDAGTLLDLLQQAGVTVETAPAAIDRAALPFVVVARAGPEGVAIEVLVHGAATGYAHTQPITGETTAARTRWRVDPAAQCAVFERGADLLATAGISQRPHIAVTPGTLEAGAFPAGDWLYLLVP